MTYSVPTLTATTSSVVDSLSTIISSLRSCKSLSQVSLIVFSFYSHIILILFTIIESIIWASFDCFDCFCRVSFTRTTSRLLRRSSLIKQISSSSTSRRRDRALQHRSTGFVIIKHSILKSSKTAASTLHSSLIELVSIIDSKSIISDYRSTILTRSSFKSIFLARRASYKILVLTSQSFYLRRVLSSYHQLSYCISIFSLT